MKNLLKILFKPRLKLVKGTRAVSFLFISCAIAIAAGILMAANIYYNIDTGEVVTEEIQRVTGILRATAGAIIGGTSTQNPSSGYSFEVVGKTKLATTTLATGQLEFSGSDTYIGFKAPASYGTSTPKIYTLPQHGNYPPQTDYVLTWQAGDQLMWKEVSGVTGAGDITAVGDCPSGDCFTETGTAGTSLWFYDAQGRGKLTIADLTAPHTYTLPDATGTIALGTGTAGYVAYWSDANTLTAEAQLSVSRGGTGTSTTPTAGAVAYGTGSTYGFTAQGTTGQALLSGGTGAPTWGTLGTTYGGTGQDSSSWTGMVKVNGGTWSAFTNTANYVAVWDSNGQFITGVQTLDVSRGGTGATSLTQYGVLYGNNTSAIGATAAGNVNQILISGGGTSAPSWTDIANLIDATSGLTESGTSTLTLKLGGTLTETTTITQGDYDLIFALNGSGDFRITDGSNNIFQVTDDGKVLFGTNNYAIAESGKQILREMIPILGFDLPAQTATTSYVQISRTIEDYPFSATTTGTVRVHKFIIRYADATTTASSSWRVYNETESATTATFTVPATASTSLDKGEVYITSAVTIPTDADDWRLEIQTPGSAVRVYQIFLAAYDQIQ